MSTSKVGLSLGGGGAKGLCHISFVKALDEMGVRPAVISGTSIGSIIGAFYAAGVTGLEMETELKKVDFGDLYKLVDFSIFGGSAILSGKGVEQFLAENLPVGTFEELDIPLKIIATDFWRRREVIFESGELVPAIRASISMAAVFEPVVIEDKVLVDGGGVNPLPYDVIRDTCDLLIAIDVSGEKTPPDDAPVPGVFESIMSTFQIMQASIVAGKMKASQPDLYVKPALRNIRVLEFHRYDEILESVTEEVERFKRDLEELLQRNAWTRS